MPAISRKVGDTSVKLPVFIPDATVSTGAGLANIVASTVSFAYWRDNMAAVSTGTCTTGTLGTYGVSSLVQMSSTAALGWYQFSPPNDAFASGALAVLHLYGAPSMAPVPILIDLSTQASALNTLAGVSTVTIPVGVSSGAIGVTSASIPFGVSSIATPVTASSVTAAVNVSSLHGSAAVTTAAGVLSVAVSSVGAVASVTAPVGVSTVTIPVGVSSVSIPVSVSSVTDKAGYSVSSATAGVNEAIADALLNRNVSTGANTGRTVKQALYAIRNKVDLNLGIVYETDDTTSSWSFSVSTVAGDPIQVIDPA